MNAFLLLGIAILSEVVATSALRASDGFTRPLPSALVVAGYGRPSTSCRRGCGPCRWA